jgi:hypothetical protein
MDRYDAWQLNPLLPHIRRAAGIDPDGPLLVPMQRRQPYEQVVQAAHHLARDVARDRMLCRAIRVGD